LATPKPRAIRSSTAIAAGDGRARLERRMELGRNWFSPLDFQAVCEFPLGSRATSQQLAEMDALATEMTDQGMGYTDRGRGSRMSRT
jgi:hypothetical protein